MGLGESCPFAHCKIVVLGVFGTLNGVRHHRPQSEGTCLGGTTPLCGQILRIYANVQAVALTMKHKRKKTICLRGVRPRPLLGSTGPNVCPRGAIHDTTPSAKFHQDRSTGARTVRGQKSHFPIGTAIGLYNSLHYRYDRDEVAISPRRFLSYGCSQ
jgi:hypothetical protein